VAKRPIRTRETGIIDAYPAAEYGNGESRCCAGKCESTEQLHDINSLRAPWPAGNDFGERARAAASLARRWLTLTEGGLSMRTLAMLGVLLVMLTGCREVRVRTYAQGTVPGSGGDRIAVVRNRHELEELGIRAPVRFNHEFGILLLMGPHTETGWRQAIESIRANAQRVRIVAFERPPADGGEPAQPYRTYTLWIIPNSVYRTGSVLDVVTPEGDPLASTILK
jgi:hypothetical protein